MDYTLLILALLFAVVEWLAVEKQWKTVEFCAKPAVMIILILWVWQNDGFHGWMIWFVFGAFFSLGGDIFLMFQRKFFLAGLVSFFVAQITYLVGFNRSLPQISAAGIVVFLILTIIAWQFYVQLSTGLKARNLDNLIFPILIYVIIISMMTFSAILILFREEWRMQSALLVSAGGILFFISDAINGWDRFVNSFSHARLVSMIAYYLAQAGILIGATLNFT